MSKPATPKLKELLALPDNTSLPFVRGQVSAVGKYEAGKTGDTQQEWSLQEIILSDDTGSLPVRIGNHPEIPQSKINAWLGILAAQRPSGAYVGVKVIEEQDPENKRAYKLLAVSRSASLTPLAAPEPGIAAEPAKVEPAKPEPAPSAPAPLPPMPSVKEVLKEFEHAKVVEPPGAYPPPSPNWRIKELRYERTVNTGNYCSEKLGVTMAVEEGENPDAVLSNARLFINNNLPPEFIPPGGRKV